MDICFHVLQHIFSAAVHFIVDQIDSRQCQNLRLILAIIAKTICLPEGCFGLPNVCSCHKLHGNFRFFCPFVSKKADVNNREEIIVELTHCIFDSILIHGNLVRNCIGYVCFGFLNSSLSLSKIHSFLLIALRLIWLWLLSCVVYDRVRIMPKVIKQYVHIHVPIR